MRFEELKRRRCSYFLNQFKKEPKTIPTEENKGNNGMPLSLLVKYMKGINLPESISNKIQDIRIVKNRITELHKKEPQNKEELQKLEKKKRNLKDSLPCWTLSMVCTHKKDHGAGIVRHSGLIQIDIDDYEGSFEEAFQIVKECPNVLVVARSASGAGIKAIGLCERHKTKEEHLGSWLAFQKYFRERGLEIDQATKNLNRLFYYTLDPDLVIKDSADVITPLEVPKIIKRETRLLESPLPTDVVEEVLAEIATKGKPSYSEWQTIVGATANAVGEENAPEACEKFFPSSDSQDARKLLESETFNPIPWESIKNLVPYGKIYLKHFGNSSLLDGTEDASIMGKLEEIESLHEKLITEYTKAELFCEVYNGEIKHCPSYGWLLKAGLIWQKSDNRVQDIAGRFHKLLMHELTRRNIDGILSKHEFEYSLRLAKSLGQQGKIKAMLELVKNRPEIHIQTVELDKDPWKIATKGKIIDLKTGKSLEDYSGVITKTCNVEYDSKAKCPEWERFIQEVFEGNEELIIYIQKAIGYSMTGDTRHQCYFFCQGMGANGKSTLLNTIGEILGDYFEKASQAIYSKNKWGNSNGAEMANMKGVRLCIAGETERGVDLAESQIKDMTGGEKISANPKYKTPFTYLPVLKLWFAGNHKPRIKGKDEGTWRRIKAIKFNRRFTDKDKRPELSELLKAEASGILNWMIAGCLKWQEQGLEEPECVKEWIAEYRRDEDPLEEFIGLYLQRTESDKDRCSKAEVHEAYRLWSLSTGFAFPMSINALTIALKERDFQECKDGKIGRGWKNLVLVSQEIEEETLEGIELYS